MKKFIVLVVMLVLAFFAKDIYEGVFNRQPVIPAIEQYENGLADYQQIGYKTSSFCELNQDHQVAIYLQVNDRNQIENTMIEQYYKNKFDSGDSPVSLSSLTTAINANTPMSEIEEFSDDPDSAAKLQSCVDEMNFAQYDEYVRQTTN